MSSVLFVLNASTGGAGLSARDLVVELKKKGHQIFVVCPPNIHQSPEEIFGDIADGVHTLFLPAWDRKYRMSLPKRPLYFAYQLLKSRGHLRPVLGICRLIRQWKIDLVHTNTALTIDGALAARLCNIPHIWHIREQIGGKALFRFSLPEPALARVFGALSTRIIANSRFSRSFFVRHGVDDKSRVIYNGIDLSAFDTKLDASPLRRRWGATEDTIVFGMLANVTSHFKRHEVFIRAAAIVMKHGANARFVVVGFDPLQTEAYRSDHAYATHLRAVARTTQVSSRLTWAGYQEDVPATMSALDVLVHPCEQEGFGRIAVEAMAARIPAIVSDAGGLAEIVEEGITGLKVAPNDISGFAKAMETLCVNEPLRKKMGRQGRQRAEEMFSLENMVTEMEQVYQEITENA
jgi:glycosyltransferase involved in cell wall biosynthesis